MGRLEGQSRWSNDRLARVLGPLLSGASASAVAADTATVVAPFPPRGKSLIRTAFMLSDSDVLLNHGSYGATPRMVVQRQQELVAQLESNPDTW